MPSPRAILLNVSLYASLIMIMILALPTLVLPRAVLMKVVRWWGRYFMDCAASSADFMSRCAGSSASRPARF